MRITLVRDDGKVNTMRTLRIEQLVEQMKVETKTQPVSKMREVLPFMLPGDKISLPTDRHAHEKAPLLH